MDGTRRVVAGWVLEERLGSGGFGEVWKARRQHVDLFRALKLVPVAGDGAFAGWRHEIVRLEELSHPNIVRFYDADVVADEGPYHDFAWIATELCVRSLADELAVRPGRVLPPAEVAGLLDAMLAALAAAHERGCVHRDVKPANILWHASGVWKLCDFGTARLIPQGESHPRTAVVGTFPYMSPAAHRGQQDQAADLYALGVTVHEALTGARLHVRPDGMSDSEYVKLILDTAPTISPRLDGPWHDVVAALIGTDGAHTAAALRDRFHRHEALLSSSTSVTPATSPDRAQGRRQAADQPRPRHGIEDAAGAPNRSWRPDASTEAESVTPTLHARASTSRGTRRDPDSRTPTLRRDGTPSQAGRTPREQRRRDKARRRAQRGSGTAGLVALVVLLLGSVGVAGVLLYSAVPNPLLVFGIVAAVLLVTVVLMAVF